MLIPCGVTQAMMTLAVASGSAAKGALIMFAFVLGTTPLFFALAYLATKLGAAWQSAFWKITGLVILALGAIAIYSALVLFGLPVRFTNVQPNPKALTGSAAVAAIGNNLTMDITDQAYTPAVMRAQAGLPINLTVKTHGLHGCAGSLVISSLNMQRTLLPTDTQTILIPSQSAGNVVRLTCVMGMYNAEIDVE